MNSPLAILQHTPTCVFAVFALVAETAVLRRQGRSVPRSTDRPAT